MPALADSADLAVMCAVGVGAAERPIVVLEAALRAAQLASDVATLDRLLADALLFTGPDGTIGSKADDLRAYRDGVVRFMAHSPDELRVRLVGPHCAIAALRTRSVVRVAGAESRGTYRDTRVWACEADAAWRVVGGHVSLIAPHEQPEA